MLKLHRILRGLVATTSVALLLMGAAPVAHPAAVPAAQPAAVASASQVVGSGWLATATCVGCAAGFLAAGGTSLVGLAILIGTNPELATACAGACALAFS